MKTYILEIEVTVADTDSPSDWIMQSIREQLENEGEEAVLLNEQEVR